VTGKQRAREQCAESDMHARLDGKNLAMYFDNGVLKIIHQYPLCCNKQFAPVI